jgi:aerobic carbon-monoxide dehydrogenase medium subunit
VKAAPFAYDAPTTPEEAVGMLAEHGDEAKVLAGGQSLIPMLALRLAVFERLVDIGRIDGLRGIERRNGALWVGAGTTDAEVEHSAEVAASAPLVAKATPLIGHFQIRNRGTVGGSIAHADPAAEYPAVALALDAEMDVLSPAGRRSVAARDFFTGLWSTALGPDELLVGVSFPIWTGRCGTAVEELARRHGDFAIAGAAVAVQLADDHDEVVRCAVALIGMGSEPVRASSAEAAATGAAVDDVDAAEVGRLASTDAGDPPSDLHGSSAYRRRVCAAVVARAWTSAVEEARRG